MPLRRGAVVAVLGVLLASFVVLPPAADMLQAPRATLVLAAAALAVWMSPRVRRGKAGSLAGILLISAAALLVASAVSNGLASGVWGVHGRFSGLVSGATLAFAGIAGYVAVGPYLERLATWAAVPVVAIGAVMLAQSLGGHEPDGLMGNPVLAGSWFAVATAVCLAAGVRASGRIRWLLLVAAGVGALAAGLAGSRGAWVGLAAGVLAVAIGARGRSVWRTVIPISIVALVVGALLAGPVVGWKLSVENLTSGSAASRLRIWDDTIDVIADRPLLGVGPGRYLYEFPQYQSTDHAVLEGPDIRPDQAHSVVMHAAAEGGLPYALLLAALFAVALRASWSGARAGHPGSLVALAGLSAFGGQAVFGISTIETDALVWLVGGAGIAVADIAAARSSAGGETGRSVPSSRAVQRATAVLAAVAFLGAAYYVANDVRDGAGDDAFALADFSGAWESYHSAVDGNPLTDTYRLDLTDASSFLIATGRDGRVAETLAVVDEGLRLEPADHDLLLARARLLARADVSPVRVLEGYLSAIEAYPLGVAARSEAMFLALEAGDADLAEDLARGVLEVAPEDPVALETLEAVAR